MSYVNMTVDDITKKTTAITFKGADGSTKTATLSAVVEASDQTGTAPSGTKAITENGLHDVSGYQYAQVDVPSSDGSTFETYTASASCTSASQMLAMLNADGITARNDCVLVLESTASGYIDYQTTCIYCRKDLTSSFGALTRRASGTVSGMAAYSETSKTYCTQGDVYKIIPLP